jgi:hypothetical protein
LPPSSSSINPNPNPNPNPHAVLSQLLPSTHLPLSPYDHSALTQTLNSIILESERRQNDRERQRQQQSESKSQSPQPDTHNGRAFIATVEHLDTWMKEYTIEHAAGVAKRVIEEEREIEKDTES